MIQLYQAVWCPFSYHVRAKLTELGLFQQVQPCAVGAFAGVMEANQGPLGPSVTSRDPQREPPS